MYNIRTTHIPFKGKFVKFYDLDKDQLELLEHYIQLTMAEPRKSAELNTQTTEKWTDLILQTKK